jgi:hypothetical protein
MDGLPPLLWEQHCCLPLSPQAEVGELARYARSGGSMVSANVGYSPHSYGYVLSLLDAFRRGVAADERLLFASSMFDENGLDVGPDDDYLFDESYTRWGEINYLPPERLLEVEDGLRERGYRDDNIVAILGRNFLRVAEQVWKPPSSASSV